MRAPQRLEGARDLSLTTNDRHFIPREFLGHLSRFLAPYRRACVGRRLHASEKTRIVRRISPGASAAAATGIAFFILYAALAARDVAFGDGPELTAAAITNGVAHPPGYPLW